MVRCLDYFVRGTYRLIGSRPAGCRVGCFRMYASVRDVSSLTFSRGIKMENLVYFKAWCVYYFIASIKHCISLSSGDG